MIVFVILDVVWVVVNVVCLKGRLHLAVRYHHVAVATLEQRRAHWQRLDRLRLEEIFEEVGG